MLSFFKRQKYHDDELMQCAETALELETMLDASSLSVSSEDGIVILSGKTRNERDKSRAMDAVLNSLQGSRLKFERIQDNIVVAV